MQSEIKRWRTGALLETTHGGVAETMAMICALNKMTLAGMPESVRLA
ncbi:MAG: hypothetical protein G5700_07860 [Serratia symbiotica]|nr:hypothetical protein [Serratia symbiotica]